MWKESAQLGRRQVVAIPLRRRDGGVPQQLRDRDDVRPVAQRPNRERVPQRVRRGPLFQEACPFAKGRITPPTCGRAPRLVYVPALRRRGEFVEGRQPGPRKRADRLLSLLLLARSM